MQAELDHRLSTARNGQGAAATLNKGLVAFVETDGEENMPNTR